MKILFIGDIFSVLGRKVVEENIKKIKQEETINFIIANGENISHGKGMNEGHYKWLLEQGVNVITLGNHSFQQKSIYNFIDDNNNVVRPINLNTEHGKGFVTVNYNGIKITVLQVLGNVMMSEEYLDCFPMAKETIDNLDSEIIICDMHAEATSEKIAFGYAFDGKVTAVLGTHTHVQTSDARILEKGTAYITDVGMCGPLDGVIGVKKDIIVDRYLNNTKKTFVPEDEGKTQFCAVILNIDDKTYKVKKIETIRIID